VVRWQKLENKIQKLKITVVGGAWVKKFKLPKLNQHF
jgi:hypothetical protein